MVSFEAFYRAIAEQESGNRYNIMGPQRLREPHIPAGEVVVRPASTRMCSPASSG